MAVMREFIKAQPFSVKQLVFYHTVLQAHKTITAKVPQPLYDSLSSDYPRFTRSASKGQIRLTGREISGATFKYRAMVNYNSVPMEIRTGSTKTVKVKLKKWIQANIPID